MKESYWDYKVLLLHLDLFLKNMQFDEKLLKSQKCYEEMRNRKMLEELYVRYPLYLISNMNEKELLTAAGMLGILPYIQDVLSLNYTYPMGNIMNRLRLQQPESYLVCGTNEEQEIALARRAYMDSCYVGRSDSWTSLNSTYQVENPEDIKKILKLQ